MLSVVLGVFSAMVVSSVWGESLLWVLFMSGVVVMSSSDGLVWKVGLSGELDYVSWGLSLLSVWVVFLAVLGSKTIKKTSSLRGTFMSLSMSLLGMFLLSFYVSDFMFFYLGFEGCLVPIFFMVLGWGYQPERSQAGIYMLFYTLFGSLPLFFLIMSLCSKSSGYMYAGSESKEVYFYIFLVGAFLVKFPMYSVHLWLLKAHVEAPVGGSMVLAGVMLKLGGYGLIRFLPLCPVKPVVLSEVIMCLSMWGAVLLSLSCLRQMDMKLLIASSSVVHMGLCIVGLLSLSDWGFKGAVLVMIGHGVCSSGLFYLANVVYERSHSRSMAVSKGLLTLMPSISLWWFVLLSVNMAAPPSLNLLGEVLLISTLVSWSSYLIGVVGLVSFFSAAYSLYLFSLSQHGVYLGSKSGFHSGCMLEYLVCVSHWAPLNAFIVCVAWLV
uniref:NADH-ubiquinone oxidoreductase chain 4 n=1 Tax=Brachyuropus grewingkii TaxID=686699 RepID=A0A0U1YU78_9CRUS|nr:NADH dehydrogenase subunit 4 [Brachyuropus grewingkii]AJF22808.1 NADH dehydrogenase subunit 4 [Brachyuropus grewingkii]